MKPNNLPILIGGLILAFAIVLSIVSFTTGVRSLNKTQKISMVYVRKAETALKNKDVQKAIFYAKKAIKTDANNKAAFVCLERAIAAQYKTTANPKSTKPKTTQVPKAQEATPQFGC